MRVRYDGPGHQLVGFDQTVPRGGEATFSEAEGLSLLAQPYLRITVLEEGTPSDPYDERHPFREGVFVSRDEVHVAPTGDDELEAHQGEGQHTHDEQEMQ